VVWYLLLAHFLGDFVFQTDWMVKHRDHLWVLSLHALIHFALMFILVGQIRLATWPYLLLIAILHLIQDRIKNTITSKRPDWIRISFVIDQFLHFVTIGTVTWLIQQNTDSFVAAEKPFWAIVIITYVCVTFVWFITERIFNFTNAEYLQYINNTKISRMLSRAGFVSVFLLVWRWTSTAIALSLSNPYPQSEFRQRAVLTDISVSLIAMLFLFWALR
jgi:hypothetical protein